MNRFALDLARVAAEDGHDVTLSVSRQNEAYELFENAGVPLLPIDTFTSGSGFVLRPDRLWRLRRQLKEAMRGGRFDAMLTLMPHVWSALVAPIVRREGVRYATIIHDASAHPGDPSGLVNRWLLADARHADRVFTLSRTVADQLVAARIADRANVTALFHPDLSTNLKPMEDRGIPDAPLRLLFFGRILPYKGLSLFTAAMERLHAEGFPVEIGIFGEGPLGAERERLERLGATIVNQWIGEDEIEPILARYDAMALSHVEASQSGIAALAAGARLPVVATPVGGLTEQIRDGETGVLAEDVTPEAFADAVKRMSDPDLRRRIAARISSEAEGRSMRLFLRSVVAALRDQA